MLLECTRKKHPQWWGAMVFLAPITFPYFILKSRKAQGKFLLMLFLVSFTAVVTCEVYIYSRQRQAYHHDRLTPVAQQALSFGESLKQTTADLDRALATLDRLSKVSSRINEVKQTIEFLGSLRELISKNQAVIDQLILYTKDHEAFFAGKESRWVHQVQHFYAHRNLVLYNKSLKTYADDFEVLLRYTHEHFYQITKLKTQENLNNYDEYYLRYRRAYDTHKQFNIQRLEFQNELQGLYPEIKPYLPGNRHTEAFQLWK